MDRAGNSKQRDDISRPPTTTTLNNVGTSSRARVRSHDHLFRYTDHTDHASAFFSRPSETDFDMAERGHAHSSHGSGDCGTFVTNPPARPDTCTNPSEQRDTRRSHQSSTMHSGPAPHVRDASGPPRAGTVETLVRPRGADVIPAALAAETRLLMKRGDTVAGSRPTTEPHAQTLRFQSERRTTSLVTVSSGPPVELVSTDVSQNETTVYRELAASFSHTGPRLSNGLLSVGFGDVDAVSDMYPDHPPGLSVSSRDTCVPSVVALRQRLDHGRNGVGPHMNSTGPDVSDGPREACVSSRPEENAFMCASRSVCFEVRLLCEPRVVQ